MSDASPAASPAAQSIEIRIRFRSDPLAVRLALGSILQGLTHVELPEDVRGTLELVLAEALNNVVEHAHSGRGDGVIEIRVSHDGIGGEPVLVCELIDDGEPMLGGEPPPPCSFEIEADTAMLPEGGFGWGLIHQLAHDVDYERRGGRNRLRFQLDAIAPADAG